MEVGIERKHLYRAVDSDGNATEFMLSAERDAAGYRSVAPSRNKLLLGT